MLFDKKYPAIVLSQAHMLAFHYMQEGLRFILGDEMERILHMTMDFSRGSSDEYGYKYLSTEYDALLLLKNGESLSATIHIKVHFKDGEWTIGVGDHSRNRFIFKNKKDVGRTEFVFRMDCTNGKFFRCNIDHYHPNGKMETGLDLVYTQNDEVLLTARKFFLEE